MRYTILSLKLFDGKENEFMKNLSRAVFMMMMDMYMCMFQMCMCFFAPVFSMFSPLKAKAAAA